MHNIIVTLIFAKPQSLIKSANHQNRRALLQAHTDPETELKETSIVLALYYSCPYTGFTF